MSEDRACSLCGSTLETGHRVAKLTDLLTGLVRTYHHLEHFPACLTGGLEQCSKWPCKDFLDLQTKAESEEK